MLTLNDGRSELWQWDTGRALSVDADCSQVHFSNKVFGRSVDVDVVDGVAIIPDVLLQTDKELTAWAFVGTAKNGYTKISKTFKINRRNRPANYIYTPSEQITLKEAISEAIERELADIEPYNPIDPAIVNDVFKCAMSYVNNKDNLIFTDNGSGSQFDDDFDINNPLFDCSSMMMAWVQGIPYEYSRYVGLNDNIRHFRYGIKLPQNPYSEERPSRYYTNELAHYLHDKGYCFVPNGDYSNIAPGDIIFVSFKTRDGDDFHDNAFMKIDHCLLVVGYKDETHLTCLHTSETHTFNFYDVCVKESAYDDTSDNSYNDGIVLVARIPYKNISSLPIEPVFANAESYITTSPSNGFLKTLKLPTPLKKNTTYTAIAQIKNAFEQQMPSYTNYVGLRASYASGAADATIVSWQKNKYPDDDVYYMRFVVGDDPITALKLYVLNNNVSGHKYTQFKLYEGFVFTTLID